MAVTLATLAATAVPVAPVHALPDGWGYEMVSPLDKNGGEVSVKSGFGAPNGMVSVTGDRVAYTSKSAFAGAVANPIINSYVGTRGGFSWLTSNVTARSISDVSGCCPQVSEVIEASDDLSKVISSTSADPVTGVAQPRYNHFLHDVETGSYRLLTPDPVSGPVGYNPQGLSVNFGAVTSSAGHAVYATAAELTTDAVALPDESVKAYVVDTSTGAVTLASVTGGDPGTPVAIGAGDGLADYGGLLGNSSHDQHGLSEDGSKVLFGIEDGGLYQRDLEAGATTQVNLEESSTQVIAPGEAVFHDATPDGRYVFFLSDQQLVDGDTDAFNDLYRWDGVAPEGERLTLISRDEEPSDAEAGTWGSIGTSADGQRVYFNSESQLVDGGPTGSPDNLTLWDHGELKLVGSGDIGGFMRGVTFGPSNQRPRYTDVSSDGSYLTVNVLGFTPLSAEVQVFLYSAESGPLNSDLACVSCRPAPQATPEYAVFQGLDASNGQYPHDAKSFVTRDGRVVFETPAALLPEDTNGTCTGATYDTSQCVDIYTYKDGELDIVSSGRADTAAHIYGASEDGTTLAFYTAAPLSSFDTDGVTDAYVARIGGGFEPDPNEPGCAGDECQGPLAGGPSLLPLGSGTVGGRGDQRPAQRAAFSLARVGAAARLRMARTGKATMSVRVNRAGRVTVRGRAKVAGRTRTVAAGSKRALRAGLVKVSLRLSPAARRSLAMRGRLRVSLSVRLSGATEPRTTVLNLRLPRSGERKAGGR